MQEFNEAKRVRKNALSLQNSRVSTLVEATGLEPNPITCVGA